MTSKIIILIHLNEIIFVLNVIGMEKFYLPLFSLTIGEVPIINFKYFMIVVHYLLFGQLLRVMEMNLSTNKKMQIQLSVRCTKDH